MKTKVSKATKKAIFEIRDWTDKLCFNGLQFPSFEDGWDHIYTHDRSPVDANGEEIDEQYYSDYYVLPAKKAGI